MCLLLFYNVVARRSRHIDGAASSSDCVWCCVILPVIFIFYYSWRYDDYGKCALNLNILFNFLYVLNEF